jgi:hypothetical protein
MPTGADVALIAYARASGRQVTARQLKRWRILGLLPPRTVRGRGRARGVEGRDKPWVRYQLIAVLDALDTKRSADEVILRLWYDGWDINTRRVREIAEQRVLAERERYAELSARAAAVLTAVTAFDIAELNSAEIPIARAELQRVRPLASSEDSPRQLAHAARIAVQGQLLSSPSEPIAIQEDLARRFFDLHSLEPLFHSLGAHSDEGLDTVLTGLQQIDPLDVLGVVTETQLEHARWRLRRLAEASDLVRHARDDEIPALARMLFAELLDRMTAFAPDHPDYTQENLITCLRVMASLRRAPVQFTE